MCTATEEVDATGGCWVNEAWLRRPPGTPPIFVVARPDAEIRWWRDGGRSELRSCPVPISADIVKFQAVRPDSRVTTNFYQDVPRTFAEVVESERKDREDSRKDGAPAGQPPDESRFLRLRGGVTSVDVLRDAVSGGVVLAAGTTDGSVHLLVEDGTLDRHVLQADGPPVTAVRFATTREGVHAVAADEGPAGTLRAWTLDPEQGLLPRMTGGVPTSLFVEVLELSPGRWVLVTVWPHGVSVREPATGVRVTPDISLEEVTVTGAGTGRLRGTPVFAVVAQGSAPGSSVLGIWDAARGTLVAEQEIGPDAVYDTVYVYDDLVVARARTPNATAAGAPIEDDAPERGAALHRWRVGDRAYHPEPLVVRWAHSAPFASRGESIPLTGSRLSRLPGGAEHHLCMRNLADQAFVVDLRRERAYGLSSQTLTDTARAGAMLDGRPVALAEEDRYQDSDQLRTEAIRLHRWKLPGERDISFTDAPEGITAVAAAENLTTVAAAGADGVLAIWRDRQQRPETIVLRSLVHSLHVTGDGVVVAHCVRGLIGVRAHPT